MRINVLTPGFTTSNGAAFLFPLVVHKRQLQDAGMETWPKFYQKDVTYLHHDWDLHNLEERIEWAISHENERIEIAAAGQERYIEFTSGPQAGKLFVSHLRDILSA
tara:strand:- start:1678 stop:1995 length:318 start_codon:yes stop_codon:yes gene_type:complete